MFGKSWQNLFLVAEFKLADFDQNLPTLTAADDDNA